jgi:hypothetical protein
LIRTACKIPKASISIIINTSLALIINYH